VTSQQEALMKTPVILVVEGNDARRRQVRGLLPSHGVEVVEAPDGPEMLQRLTERKPDLIILGSSPEGSRDDMALAREIRTRDAAAPLLLLGSNGVQERGIGALRAVFAVSLEVPLHFAASGRSFADHHRPSPRIGRSPHPADDGRLVGDSAQMQAIRQYISRVAPSDSTVLITGETGTGKEVVAQLIHKSSARGHRAFVAVNCAAIPDTLLESELFGYERGAFTGAHASQHGKLRQADGGTVLLDEIGEMSPCAQSKVLRAIESHEIHPLGGRRGLPLDVRVIAATNQDLEHLVAQGKFRKDLYFRLSVVRIDLPPLRGRREDIAALLDHYIDECNRRLGTAIAGVNREVLEALLRHSWPGNVRELRNLVEAVTLMRPSGWIGWTELPEHTRRSLEGRPASSQGDGSSERDQILSALLLTNWNKRRAAQQLHWSRMTLYRKLAKYHITEVGQLTASGGRPLV
jgi:DNA-binding NtrC family response regulator